MRSIQETPTFNLKAVINETGLKPDTLRAWERRYGLPQPERTPGGHRVYSQRDIDMLKWLIARQEEGLSISRAIDLWRTLEAEGQDPLRVPAFAISEGPPTPAYVPTGEAISELRQAWISACLAFDEQTAEHVLAHAFALYPPETVCFELLQKGVAEVGDGWYRGETSVQQEHFTSSLAMRRLDALIAAAPAPTRPSRVLVGCPPEEAHTFAPLLITFLLKRQGWDVVYLGARVPAVRFAATIDSVRPHLAILPAQQLHTAATLLEVAQLLQQKDVPLAFGGKIFNLIPALRDRIPGHFLGEELEKVPQVIEGLLTSPPPLPPVEAISESYQQALAHYRERHMLVEAEVWRSLGPLEVPPAHLTVANAELARNITAALLLGDIDYVSTDISWIQELLSNFQMPRQALSHYLNLYYQAAKKHLDEQGDVIVEWLAGFNDSVGNEK